MKKNALIIAPNFPPINKVSSLRPYYLAMLLKDQGWQVTVIAAIDKEGNAGLVRSEEGIKVLRVASFFMALIAILREFLGGVRFNVIVSTYGPTPAHFQGCFAKILFGKAIWLADYRDLWMSGSYYAPKKQGFIHKLKQFVEKLILRKADILTTVSLGLKNNLEKFHHKNVHVVYNGYEPIEKIEPQPVSMSESNGVQICYTGSMYFERSPFLLLNAIAEQSKIYPNVTVKLVIAGVVSDDVKDQLKPYERDRLIEYKGKLSREASYELQRNSDYCLLVEDYDATLQGVIPAKAFEYIGLEKPIIALGVAESSEIAGIIQNTGLMAFCGRERSKLNDFIAGLMQNEKVEFKKEAVFIASLERNHQSQKFIALLEQFQSK